MKKKIINECLSVLIISFLFYWLNIDVSYDDIWNYGFSYNIAHGLIPYKDFNMILTPLYPIIMSLFLKIKSSICIFYLVNAIINTVMYYLIRKEKGNSAILFIFLMLLFCPIGYNVFILFLFIMLIYFENNNYSPVLIGMIASLAVLTKQSVFPFLTVALILGSDKKSIKYRLLGYLIPFIMFYLYLLMNSAVYEFIDYCFLGLKNFGENNFLIRSFWLLSVYIILNLYIIYLLFKSKLKNKELMYILSLQILAFPIFEISHASYCFLIILFYFLGKFKLNFNFQLLFILILLFIPITPIITLHSQISFNHKLDLFQFRPFYKNIDADIYECINEINQTDYDELYIFDSAAYIIKLEMDLKINKYDLINNGNMGSGGAKKYIEEVSKNCGDKKCLIVLRNYLPPKGDQLNIEILEYVKDNYELTQVINNFEFYQNDYSN